MKAEELIGMKLPEKDATITLEADEFYNTGMQLIEKLNVSSQESVDTVKDMRFFPAVVNLAFACELYLKSMIKEDDRKKGQHHLKTLFSFQEEVIRELMIREAIENIKDINSEADFNKRLENISDTFFRWRYFYEPGLVKDMLDVWFLKLFAYMLKNIDELYK